MYYTVALGSMEPKDRWCGSASSAADAIDQAILHNGGVEPKFVGIWRQSEEREGESVVIGPTQLIGSGSAPKGGA